MNEHSIILYSLSLGSCPVVLLLLSFCERRAKKHLKRADNKNLFESYLDVNRYSYWKGACMGAAACYMAISTLYVILLALGLF
jgi:hypothetical protein